MLNEWKKVKNIFKKPKLRIYFGLWSTPRFVVKLGNYLMKSGFEKHPFLTKVWHLFSYTDQSLPVWRRGNMIYPFRKHQVYNKGSYVWDDEFKEKLNKYHLDWLKCSYELPICLSCYIFKHDMMWKWKYDDIRYEFPPQFTIVLFNISLTFHWHAPTNDIWDDDGYWESILTYNHKKDEFVDIISLAKYMGISRMYTCGDKTPKYKCVFKPEFLKCNELANELFVKEARWITDMIEKDKFLKCDNCGHTMYINEDYALSTYPVQYEYICPSCKSKKYSTKQYDCL